MQRGGKVAYSFVARCIASFARGEKSRRPFNGHLNGLARWFMEPERKIGVASINGSEKSALFSPVACPPVDLSMRNTPPIYDGHLNLN